MFINKIRSADGTSLLARQVKNINEDNSSSEEENPHKLPWTITLHSEAWRAQNLVRIIIYLRDWPISSQSILQSHPWGVVFRAVAFFCCCSLLSYCFTRRPGIAWHMPILSLRQHISEQKFPGGFPGSSRNHYAKLLKISDCVMFCERKVSVPEWHETEVDMTQKLSCRDLNM